jgi:multicomponent K+:H+ antiporter subunit D
MDFLSLHLPVLPVLLPAVTAIALLLIGDDGRRSGLAGEGSAADSAPGGVGARWKWARRLALLSTFLGLLLAARLVADAAGAGAAGNALAGSSADGRAYLLGNWAAPFGIVLVVDRLAAACGCVPAGPLMAPCPRLRCFRDTTLSPARTSVLPLWRP